MLEQRVVMKHTLALQYVARRAGFSTFDAATEY